jgi:(E)-4-hydroxy-3-methylbut-2-enyl-diphosphate synthase
LVTIAANRELAKRVPYPLHLGVTEAGTRWAGSIRSAVALGVLLAEGIGDTIRVSLTGDPVEEVRVALEILRTLDLAPRGPRVISCPTCGRTRIDLEPLALEVERRLVESGMDLEVAVMGCVVNGPGEAGKADFGIAGGEGEGVVFAGGRPVRKVPQADLVEALFAEIASRQQSPPDC